MFVCLFVCSCGGVCVCVCVCVRACVCGMSIAVSSVDCEVWDLLRIKLLCESHTAQQSVLMDCHVFLGYIAVTVDVSRRRKAVSKFKKTFNVLST